MVITILVPITSEVDLARIKPFLDNVESCGYPKGRIEVVFLVVSQDDRGFRVFQGPPIVKVRYYKNYVDSLNDGIKKALGHLIVFINVKVKLDSVKLSDAIRSFDHGKHTNLFINAEFFVFSPIFGDFPPDLFCLKTYLILQILYQEATEKFRFGIVGPWGRLHHKEILRSAYKMDKIKLRDKLRLLGGCR